MFTNIKTKTSKIMALILAVSMILGMIPVSLMTVFAATVNHPDAVTITVVDDVTGEPIEGAKVTYVIYDNDAGEDKMGNNDVPTDSNGEMVVFDGSEPGNIKISSITVTHDDYATYTNATYVVIDFDEYNNIAAALQMRKAKIDGAADELIDENTEALRELAK